MGALTEECLLHLSCPVMPVTRIDTVRVSDFPHFPHLAGAQEQRGRTRRGVRPSGCKRARFSRLARKIQPVGTTRNSGTVHTVHAVMPQGTEQPHHRSSPDPSFRAQLEASLGNDSDQARRSAPICHTHGMSGEVNCTAACACAV